MGCRAWACRCRYELLPVVCLRKHTSVLATKATGGLQKVFPPLLFECLCSSENESEVACGFGWLLCRAVSPPRTLHSLCFEVVAVVAISASVFLWCRVVPLGRFRCELSSLRSLDGSQPGPSKYPQIGVYGPKLRVLRVFRGQMEGLGKEPGAPHNFVQDGANIRKVDVNDDKVLIRLSTDGGLQF